MSINIENLSFEYNVRSIDEKNWFGNIFSRREVKVCIYQGLSLSISENSGITGLLGKNGSGKTTLIKIITGILQPTSGTVTVFSHNPSKRKKEMLLELGVMFGHKSMLWPELSLSENIDLFEAIYKRSYDSSEVYRQKRNLGLDSISDKPTKTYSLGQSVKANLLIHLLNRPKLMILDEPTVGLDVESALSLRKTLRDYVKLHDGTIIITSHNMMDIAEICDQVLFLEKGEVSVVKHEHIVGKEEKARYLESLFI